MLPNVRSSEDSELKDKVMKMVVANGLVDHVDERVWNRAREMFHSQPNVLDK
jgi:ABC-type Fe3+-citrate transport system substrate-binding protein